MIKGVKTIAEYAIKKYLIQQGFELEHFELEIVENEARLHDKNGDSVLVIYYPDTKTVYMEV